MVVTRQVWKQVKGIQCNFSWHHVNQQPVSHDSPPFSVPPPPTAKRSARRRWACTLVARAWYVGVSGGLGWYPGKTSGRSASSAIPPSAPPIRWDRRGGVLSSSTAPYQHLGEWRRVGLTSPRLPTPPTPACVAEREKKFLTTSAINPIGSFKI